MNLIRKIPKQGRIKEKYNPTPNAAEKAYHRWLIDNVPCIKTGRTAEVVHHPLQRHPHQRWRRDHEYVVPMTDAAHRELHTVYGSEVTFDPGNNYPVIAAQLRHEAIEAGILKVRAA